MGIFLLPKSLGLNFQAISIGTDNFAKSTSIESIPFNQSPIHEIVSTMGRILIIVFKTTEVPKDWDAKSHLWFILILGPFLIPNRYCLCLSFLINVDQEPYSSSNSSWLSSTGLSHLWCFVCVAGYLISYFCPRQSFQIESEACDGNRLLTQVTRLNVEEGFIFSSLVILCYCGCHLG